MFPTGGICLWETVWEEGNCSWRYIPWYYLINCPCLQSDADSQRNLPFWGKYAPCTKRHAESHARVEQWGRISTMSKFPPHSFSVHNCLVIQSHLQYHCALDWGWHFCHSPCSQQRRCLLRLSRQRRYLVTLTQQRRRFVTLSHMLRWPVLD